MKFSEESKVVMLRDKLRACYHADPIGFRIRLVPFARQLEAEHADHHLCRLYHLLVGSTSRGNYERFDFSGVDSIEAFIDREFEESAKAVALR